jgi:phage tail tape-measure protein
MDVGQTVGTIGGGIAGTALLGALDGPLPFMDIVGGSIGSAIGGDIGKAVGGKKKRMAGQIDPRLLMMNMNMGMSNPNTDGLISQLQQTHSY